MKSQIKTPQAFTYMAKIPAAKTVKGIVFRHGVAVSVHDPKVIRLLSRLPYMKPAEVAEALDVAPAKPAKAKAVSVEDIPADWRKAHHKRRMAWAKVIAGAEVTTSTEANRVIAQHLGEPEVLPEVAAEAVQVEA